MSLRERASYAGWGDGWGWNKQGPKRSIGITRISGQPPNLKGEDLWGAGPGSGFGKPEALIAYDGKLYLFWTAGRSKDDQANTATAYTSDSGVTWTLREGKAFPQVPDGFRVRGIAQFGRGYAGARDGFVYVTTQVTTFTLGRRNFRPLMHTDEREWLGIRRFSPARFLTE